MKSFFIILLCSVINSFAIASDHIDGVPNSEHPHTDLTDLYVFKTPNKDNNLTTILNLYPGVSKNGHFSNKVKFNILIQEAKITNFAENTRFTTNKSAQAKIECSFKIGHHGFFSDEEDLATCKLTKKEGNIESEITQVTVPVNQISAPSKPLVVFTGARRDPFFLSIESFEGVTKRKEFVTQNQTNEKFENIMDTANALSIALEIDITNLFDLNQNPLLAVAAESFRKNEHGENIIIDRVGRPEITNLSLHRFKGDSQDRPPIKEDYNQKISNFTTLEGIPKVFIERLKENISAYDKIDGNLDWNNGEELNHVVHLLAEDFLVINMTTSCENNDNQFLAIEKSLINKELSSNSCGGRKINDNIMANLYALYLAGPTASYKNYLDGVNKPYHKIDQGTPALSTIFPYLRKPGRTKLKTKAGIWYLKQNQD